MQYSAKRFKGEDKFHNQKRIAKIQDHATHSFTRKSLQYLKINQTSQQFPKIKSGLDLMKTFTKTRSNPISSIIVKKSTQVQSWQSQKTKRFIHKT